MSGLFHVSARDHGALILMSSLAEVHASSVFVSLRDIAENMKLSQGYLEEVAASLKSAGLIEGKQGPNGGYRLTRAPGEISIADILTALEGPMELVDCQSKGAICPVSHKCSSKNVWKSLQQTISQSLESTTLASIL